MLLSDKTIELLDDGKLTELIDGGAVASVGETYAAACREQFDRDRMGRELRRIVDGLAQGATTGLPGA